MQQEHSITRFRRRGASPLLIAAVAALAALTLALVAAHWWLPSVDTRHLGVRAHGHSWFKRSDEAKFDQPALPIRIGSRPMPLIEED